MRYKQIFFISFLLFTHSFSWAKIDSLDTQSIDSLKRLLENEKVDTIKIKILYQIAENYWDDGLLEALSYHKIAQSIALKVGDDALIVDSYIRISELYNWHKLHDWALASCNEAMDYQKGKKSPRLILTIYAQILSVYRSSKQNTKFIEVAKKGYDLALQQKDSIWIPSFLNDLGVGYLTANQPEKAITLFLKEIPYLENSNSTDVEYLKTLLYNNIGVTYHKLASYEESLIFFKKSLDLTSEISQKVERAELYKELSSLEREYYLAYYSKLIANTEINMGISYKDLEEYDLALQYLEKGLETSLELQDDFQVQKAYPVLSELHHIMGEEEKATKVYKDYVEYLNEVNSLKDEKRIETLKDSTIHQQQAATTQNKAGSGKGKAPLFTLLAVSLSLFLVVLVVGFYRYQAVPKKKEKKATVTPLSDPQIQQLKSKIQTYIEEEKPYLNPDFRLKEMADALEMNTNDLSQGIKEGFNQNFLRLINGYRTEEVKKLLQDKKYSHLTLLAIGLEAGFNSKTTFNTVFKKMTGKTPSQYQKEISKKDS